MFRKPSFTGMQKSHRKQNKKITVIKNNKTKVVVGAYLSRSKKKGRLYNTYHELLSEKWIFKRS